MKLKLLVRKSHRYLALIVSIQLFLWSVGGLYFSLISIDEIHGDHLRSNNTSVNLLMNLNIAPVSQVFEQLAQETIDRAEVEVVKVELITVNQKPLYKIRLKDKRVLWFDATSALPLVKMNKQQIKEIAAIRSINAGNIIAVNWLTQVEIDSEYRSKLLPVYQVVFDGDDNLNLYLDGYSGQVMSLRTSKWRIFDFLWMLHVMDYETRDNFNHLLLQFFAALAVLTSLSGLILWGVSHRSRQFWKNNKHKN